MILNAARHAKPSFLSQSLKKKSVKNGIETDYNICSGATTASGYTSSDKKPSTTASERKISHEVVYKKTPE